MRKSLHSQRCPRHLSLAIPVALLAAPLVARGPVAGQDIPAPSPFAGFETHYLSNGVKVWFKRLPGSPDVYVGAGVPVGAYAAPSDKADLAHFVEHMLLTDRDGRTEVEIRSEIERRGGRVVGFTSRKRTWFSVTVGREHGLFAIDWLSGILSPRRMEPELVERNRLPIELELGVRPPGLSASVVSALTPSRFEVPLTWEREFGPDWKRHRRTSPWRSLHSITPEDLQAFYDRYYAPGHITALVVGDLDRDQALATAEATFGAIPTRPVHRWSPAVVDPGRGRGQYEWRYASGQIAHTTYRLRYKLYDPPAEEQLLAYFIADFLYFRINDRLRFGESKVAYTVDVEIDNRSPAATLWIRAMLSEGGLGFAKEAIDEEIRALRTGTFDSGEFEATRATVLERTRAAALTSESLASLTMDRFFYPEVFADVPDLLSFYAGVTQDQVASYAQGLFAESNRIVLTSREPPVSPLVAVLSVLALLSLTLALARREPGQPLRQRDIIYIARFRLPVALSVGYGAALAALLLVLLVTGGAVGRWAIARWLWPVDSFALYGAVHAVVLVVVFAGLCRLLAWVPHELIVARDHLRVASRSWRSRILRHEDIAGISIHDFRHVWLSRSLLRGLPLTLGIRQPGILIRPRRGRAYFFRSRNTVELAEILEAWWAPPPERVLDDSRDLRPSRSRPNLDGEPVAGVPG